MDQLKPDYGLKLSKDGFSKDGNIVLHSFLFDHVVRIDTSTYSTMSVILYNDTEYAISIDYSYSQLQEILNCAPNNLVDSLKLSTKKIQIGQVLNLEPFTVSLTLQLGELVEAAYESFVPFRIVKIKKI
jgi:hypothetical protein